MYFVSLSSPGWLAQGSDSLLLLAHVVLAGLGAAVCCCCVFVYPGIGDISPNNHPFLNTYLLCGLHSQGCQPVLGCVLLLYVWYCYSLCWVTALGNSGVSCWGVCVWDYPWCGRIVPYILCFILHLIFSFGAHVPGLRWGLGLSACVVHTQALSQSILMWWDPYWL